jgi:hypothetical protein
VCRNHYGQQGLFDIAEYFEGLRDELRELMLVPAVGRFTIEVESMEERPIEIGEEQVRGQFEEWETEVDVGWVRQVYRRHGWPDTFRGEEAMRVVDEMLESLPEQRGEW